MTNEPNTTESLAEKIAAEWTDSTTWLEAAELAAKVAEEFYADKIEVYKWSNNLEIKAQEARIEELEAARNKDAALFAPDGLMQFSKIGKELELARAVVEAARHILGGNKPPVLREALDAYYEFEEREK